MVTGYTAMTKELCFQSDIELVELSLAGNKGAFEMLHARYYNYIWTCCFRIIKNESIAEDLTQDTFLRALCKIHYFKNGNFRGWLWKIAFCLDINEWKRIKREEKKVNSSLDLDDIQSASNNPLKNLQNKEDEQLLLNALEQLQELTRKCVIDRYCYENSRADIAKTHQLSLSQVDYQLRIGLRFLKEKLKGSV